MTLTGPTVILIACAAVLPITWAILAFDNWLSRREFDRKIRGNEVERFARARARIQAQQSNHPTRLGHRKPDDDA